MTATPINSLADVAEVLQPQVAQPTPTTQPATTTNASQPTAYMNVPATGNTATFTSDYAQAAQQAQAGVQGGGLLSDLGNVVRTGFSSGTGVKDIVTNMMSLVKTRVDNAMNKLKALEQSGEPVQDSTLIALQNDLDQAKRMSDLLAGIQKMESDRIDTWLRLFLS